MACSTGVDRAAIGDGKEEAVVLWPGICSTIVSFRYHFILGVSRFLTVCETSRPSLLLSLSPSPSLTLLPSASVSEMPLCNAFYSPFSFLFPTFASFFRGASFFQSASLAPHRFSVRGPSFIKYINKTRYNCLSILIKTIKSRLDYTFLKYLSIFYTQYYVTD